MKMQVLFLQGAGAGAYDEDQKLAASLQAALGAGYEVRYPKMPNEDSPEYALWNAQLEREFAALDHAVVLVAHSFGASVLVKYLSEEQIEQDILGLFLIGTPFWGGDEHWQYDACTLRADFAARLPNIARIFLYHSRDDEIVPFAHLALYAAKLPQAIIRTFDHRGHQLKNDLSEIAADIKRIETTSSG